MGRILYSNKSYFLFVHICNEASKIFGSILIWKNVNIFLQSISESDYLIREIFNSVSDVESFDNFTYTEMYFAQQNMSDFYSLDLSRLKKLNLCELVKYIFGPLKYQKTFKLSIDKREKNCWSESEKSNFKIDVSHIQKLYLIYGANELALSNFNPPEKKNVHYTVWFKMKYQVRQPVYVLLCVYLKQNFMREYSGRIFPFKHRERYMTIFWGSKKSKNKK